MVELSHALEDAAAQAGPGTRLYAGFQLASLYQHEMLRYARLGACGVQATVWYLPDIDVLTPHPAMLLAPEHPWADGWWVVVSGASVKMALVAEDLDGLKLLDGRRRFRGGLTFDSAVVDGLEARLAAAAGTSCPHDRDATMADLTRRAQLTGIVTGQLAHYLDRARARERDEAAMKELLASAIVHDLRNPLQVLTGFTALMQRSPDIPSQWKDWLAGMDAAGRRMDRLIGTVLDAFKIESGSMTLARSTLAPEELLRKISEHAEYPGSASLAVEVEPGLPPLWVDGNLVERLLDNLVGNAVKYGMKTRVTMSAHRAPPDQVVLRVADEGPGIPPEALENIFDRYAQLGGSGPRQGSGLGLYFCRLVAEVHGGRLVASNRPGGGAQFDLYLPIAS